MYTEPKYSLGSVLSTDFRFMLSLYFLQTPLIHTCTCILPGKVFFEVTFIHCITDTFTQVIPLGAWYTFSKVGATDLVKVILAGKFFRQIFVVGIMQTWFKVSNGK